MKRYSRGIVILLFLFALLAGSYHPAQAAEIDNDGELAVDEVVNDDVFLTGEKVTMDGTVNGILFASGETVTINGTVNGDALLFGSTVILAPGAKVVGNVFLGARSAQIEGSISGSLFGGAAAVTLEKTALIGRNLYYGGYSLQASSGSAVTRDAFLGVYQAILDGEIQRDVNFGGAALELNGRVGRNLNAEVGGTEDGFKMSFGDQQDLPKAIAPGLRVAESAVINGKMVYTSPDEQAGAIKVEPDGGMIYQTPAPNEDSTTSTKKPALTVRYPALGWLADFLRNFVTLLALGALALWLLPAVVQRIVGQARVQPVQSAGYGVLAIFSGYFSALVALVLILLGGLLLGFLSLGGLSSPIFGVGLAGWSLFLAVLTFLISTGSKLIVAYLIGQVLIERAIPQAANQQIWALVAGAALYALVRSIPIVGLIIGIAATLVGIGAMWLAYQAWRKSTLLSSQIEPVQ